MAAISAPGNASLNDGRVAMGGFTTKDTEGTP
jgi:hypothetical protein